MSFKSSKWAISIISGLYSSVSFSAPVSCYGVEYNARSLIPRSVQAVTVDNRENANEDSFAYRELSLTISDEGAGVWKEEMLVSPHTATNCHVFEGFVMYCQSGIDATGATFEFSSKAVLTTKIDSRGEVETVKTWLATFKNRNDFINPIIKELKNVTCTTKTLTEILDELW
jgi:hypothetical protein